MPGERLTNAERARAAAEPMGISRQFGVDGPADLPITEVMCRAIGRYIGAEADVARSRATVGQLMNADLSWGAARDVRTALWLAHALHEEATVRRCRAARVQHRRVLRWLQAAAIARAAAGLEPATID